MKNNILLKLVFYYGTFMILYKCFGTFGSSMKKGIKKDLNNLTYYYIIYGG